jgi:hypothetical protein
MALKIKKKKKGYGSGSSLLGGPEASWADVPQITPVPTGQVAVINTPQPATSDSTLEGELKSVDQWKANSQLGYKNQAQGLGRDYGFVFQEDANNPNAPFGFQKDDQGNYVVDPNNPFSKATLLQKSYQTSKAGYDNSYAARGLHGSGAARAAQKYAGAKYGEAQNSLVNSANSNLGALNTAYLGVGLEATTKAGEAQNRFVERRPDPAPASVSYQPAPGVTPQQAANPWIQRGLKGPNGEQLVVTNKGTYYIRKSDGKAIYIKRN